MTDPSDITIQQQEEAIRAFRVDDMSSYRDGFKNLVRLVFIQSFVMVGLIAFDYWYISTKVPMDSYYAVSPGGTTRRLVALDLPATNRDAILLWAGAAATETLTFGFNDIDERFTRARRLFSDKGWESFYQALSKSRLLRDMMSEQHIMTAIPTGTPTLVAEGIFNAEYTWVLDIPMIIAIRAGARSQTSRTKLRLLIVRLPTKENPAGLGIKTFLAN